MTKLVELVTELSKINEPDPKKRAARALAVARKLGVAIVPSYIRVATSDTTVVVGAMFAAVDLESGEWVSNLAGVATAAVTELPPAEQDLVARALGSALAAIVGPQEQAPPPAPVEQKPIPEPRAMELAKQAQALVSQGKATSKDITLMLASLGKTKLRDLTPQEAEQFERLLEQRR